MTTISIPATIDKPIRFGDPIHASILDADGEVIASMIHHGTEPQARKLLRAGAIHAIAAHQADELNYQQHIIGCTDGTVLVVQYRSGCWCYRIAGKDRNCACTCLFNSEATYQDTLENARKHAESSFGGIAWDHSA